MACPVSSLTSPLNRSASTRSPRDFRFQALRLLRGNVIEHRGFLRDELVEFELTAFAQDVSYLLLLTEIEAQFAKIKAKLEARHFFQQWE